MNVKQVADKSSEVCRVRANTKIEELISVIDEAVRYGCTECSISETSKLTRLLISSHFRSLGFEVFQTQDEIAVSWFNACCN